MDLLTNENAISENPERTYWQMASLVNLRFEQSRIVGKGSKLKLTKLKQFKVTNICISSTTEFTIQENMLAECQPKAQAQNLCIPNST